MIKLQKRLKHYLIIIFVILFSSLSINSFAAPSISIQGSSAIVMDADTGEILYENNSHQKLYPASITKVMTALLALEKGNLSDVVTYSRNAVYSIEPGSSHIALDVDEQITLEQALYALLMQSANDAANGIAEYVDGTISAFAEDMTERAKELGCENTNFVNPHGLYDKNHYTTAYDMALIAKEVYKQEKFKEIIKTLRYEIAPTNKQKETRYFHNQHKMLKSKYHKSTYFYDGCVGGKSGYTDQSRHTLITYAERDGRTLIVVVMKEPSQPAMYEDTTTLFDYAFDELHKVVFIEKNQVLDRIPIYEIAPPSNDSNQKRLGYVNVIADKSFVFTGNKAINHKTVDTQINLPDLLVSPVYKDEIVGNIKYVYKDQVLATVPLIAAETYEVLSNEVTAEISNEESSGSFTQQVSLKIANYRNITWIAFGVLFLILFIIILRIIRHIKR